MNNSTNNKTPVKLDKSSAETMAWINMLAALAMKFSEDEIIFMLPLIAGHAVACSEEVHTRDKRIAELEAREAEAVAAKQFLVEAGENRADHPREWNMRVFNFLAGQP